MQTSNLGMCLESIKKCVEFAFISCVLGFSFILIMSECVWLDTGLLLTGKEGAGGVRLKTILLFYLNDLLAGACILFPNAAQLRRIMRNSPGKKRPQFRGLYEFGF